MSKQPTMATFIVSVDDEWCEWSYKIKASDKLSIHDLVTKLCEAVGARVPKGKIRRAYTPKPKTDKRG